MGWVLTARSSRPPSRTTSAVPLACFVSRVSMLVLVTVTGAGVPSPATSRAPTAPTTSPAAAAPATQATGKRRRAVRVARCRARSSPASTTDGGATSGATVAPGAAVGGVGTAACGSRSTSAVTASHTDDGGATSSGTGARRVVIVSRSAATSSEHCGQLRTCSVAPDGAGSPRAMAASASSSGWVTVHLLQAGPQSGQSSPDVALDGAERQVEPLGDLFVGQVLDEGHPHHGAPRLPEPPELVIQHEPRGELVVRGRRERLRPRVRGDRRGVTGLARPAGVHVGDRVAGD